MDTAFDNTSLDRGAFCNRIIRIYRLRRLHMKIRLNILRHKRHPGRTADENHPVNLFRKDTAVRQHDVDRRVCAVDQVFCHFLKSLYGNCFVQSQRFAGLFGNHRDQDLAGAGGAQRLFASFRFFFQLHHSKLVLGKVNAMLAFKLADQPVHNFFIKILAAELVVAAAGLYLQHAVKHLQQRDIERTAAKVIDEDMAFLFHMLQAVAEGGGRRFI